MDSELKEIDCRIDLFQRIDTMAEQKRISDGSAQEVKDALRYLNGNPLFVVYLRWVEGYTTQKEIAARLGISEPAVTKIVQKKLAGLRAQLIFMAEMNAEDEDALSLDRWRNVQDVVYSADGGDALDTNGDRLGSAVKLKTYERGADPETGSFYHGSTNPIVEPSRKDPDNAAADAIKRGRAERKAERLALARQAEKIQKNLSESG